MTSHSPIFIRIQAARAVFGLPRSTIYDMARRGEVKIYKRGKISLLSVAEISALIEGRQEDAASD